jgi:hypothetical protein
MAGSCGVSSASTTRLKAARMPALDLVKLSKLLGMLGSAHDGEAASAGRLADAMLRNAGMVWSDFIEAAEQCFALLEIAQNLSSELDRANAEISRLSANGGHNGLAPALWQSPATPSGTTKRAQWALDLGAAERVWWSERERAFLSDMVRWRGRPSPSQGAWLDTLVQRCAMRTGETPP